MTCNDQSDSELTLKPRNLRGSSSSSQRDFPPLMVDFHPRVRSRMLSSSLLVGMFLNVRMTWYQNHQIKLVHKFDGQDVAIKEEKQNRISHLLCIPLDKNLIFPTKQAHTQFVQQPDFSWDSSCESKRVENVQNNYGKTICQSTGTSRNQSIIDE